MKSPQHLYSLAGLCLAGLMLTGTSEECGTECPIQAVSTSIQTLSEASPTTILALSGSAFDAPGLADNFWELNMEGTRTQVEDIGTLSVIGCSSYALDTGAPSAQDLPDPVNLDCADDQEAVVLGSIAVEEGNDQVLGAVQIESRAQSVVLQWTGSGSVDLVASITAFVYVPCGEEESTNDPCRPIQDLTLTFSDS